MRALKKIVLIIICLYSIVLLLASLFQEKLIFLPTDLPETHQYSFHVPFEEVNLKTEDATILNGLHFKSINSENVVLYFHGNAGNLNRWGHIVAPYTQFGQNVFIIDYRGYGKSTGAFNEVKMYKDAQLAYNYLLKFYKSENITVYGRSLGTTFATYIASKNKVKQLILETPFYSIEEIAKKRFPFLPVTYLLNYKFPSNEFIVNVKCPITVFHGTADTVVPYDSGYLLSGLAKSNTMIELITIENGTHNNLVHFPKFQEKLKQLLLP